MLPRSLGRVDNIPVPHDNDTHTYPESTHVTVKGFPCHPEEYQVLCRPLSIFFPRLVPVLDARPGDVVLAYTLRFLRFKTDQDLRFKTDPKT